MKREVLATVLVTLSLLSACGSDDEGGGSGGSSATGGSAGSSGASGSAGAGATGGSSGSAGSSGASGASGASGSAGNAGNAGSAGAPPDLLSQTGLYSDIATETLAAGVIEYEPAYPLWSDGATKRRWLYLPPGAQIDTSDMDFWVYPVGTKAWKEFTRDGTRVETRLLEKIAEPDEWLMIAYQWTGADAQAVPNGVTGANGTPHDIPSQSQCQQCHDKMPDRLLSVSAIQLSHDEPGVTLGSLIADGKLSAPPAGNFTLPGSATDRAALGYLHSNCGVCHNSESFVFAQVDMSLWLSTGSLGSVATTNTYLSTVGKALTSSNPTPSTARIVAGNPAASDIHFRMNERGTLTQMPPIASKDVDSTGLSAIDAWISSL